MYQISNIYIERVGKYLDHTKLSCILSDPYITNHSKTCLDNISTNSSQEVRFHMGKNTEDEQVRRRFFNGKNEHVWTDMNLTIQLLLR